MEITCSLPVNYVINNPENNSYFFRLICFLDLVLMLHYDHIAFLEKHAIFLYIIAHTFFYEFQRELANGRLQFNKLNDLKKEKNFDYQ